MNFASDNTAPVAPEIIGALAKASEGFAPGYGNDTATERAKRRICEIFERECAIFLVPTGTGANALALAHLSPPWGAVLCHEESHIATDECGAPEFFGGGLKLIGIAGEAGGVAVHMDGARFANALARMNVSPADATWRAGVDVLSLGATKGGALAAEAVVFFDPARAGGMDERRKRGGLLLSKHRFLAAQIEAYLENNLWLSLARQANDMADRLAAALTACGIRPVWPVEANEVFVFLPLAVDARLKAAGASYYRWQSNSLPPGGDVRKDEILVRFVTSFVTSADEVDRFAEIVRAPDAVP